MAHNSSSDSASLNENTVLVVAELKSFAAFDRTMDEQMAQLVALWIHTAAPNARGPQNARPQFGR